MVDEKPKGWNTSDGEWVPWVAFKLLLYGLGWLILVPLIVGGMFAFWWLLLH